MTQDLTPNQIKKLEAERTQVLEELGNLKGYLKYEVSSDAIEVASELTNRDTVLSLIRGREQKLSEIDEALKQFSRGTYGICEKCSQPIDPARLEVLPETRFCIQCKSAMEQGVQRSKFSNNLNRL